MGKKCFRMSAIVLFVVMLMIGITVKANRSQTAKALRIPAEFTTTDEGKIWDQSVVATYIQYGDDRKKLSGSMNVSFDLFVPKDLFTKQTSHVSIYLSLGLYDDNWVWESMVEGKIPVFNIYRSGSRYKACYYDEKARVDKTFGKNNVAVNKDGKYVRIRVKNYKMNSQSVFDSGKKKSIVGRKAKLGFSFSVLCNTKRNATIYLKNSRISSGSKTIFASSHNKDDVYTFAMVNNRKMALLYTSNYNKNKMPKFEKIPDDVRNASSKDYVSRNDKRVIKNTISGKTKEKAKRFAKADYQSLPKWHGTHLDNWYTIGWGGAARRNPCFTEPLIKEVASEGFNFVRVTMDTRIVYSQNMFDETGQEFKGNGKKVNLNALKNLDDLITWCVKYGIHVCLDVHNTPGGYMLGGDEEASRELLFKEGSKEQKLFFDFWKLITERYKDVSTNALSYDLYNEPPFFATDEMWTKLMKKTINLIHDVDSTRLLFVDMLRYGKTPCYGLVGEKIVQTSHMYDPDEFSHSNYELDSSIQMGASYKPGVYDREKYYPIIENRIKEIVDFRKETGTTVMVQEFGCTCYSYMDSIVTYLDDILTLLDENDINWSAYGYDNEQFGYVSVMDCYRSKGGTYLKINPHRYVAKELREMFHKHMQV